MLEYRALAGLSIMEGSDELNLGGPRQRRLVAMLLVNRNSVVSADRLGDAVFAGEPTPGAQATIRSYVARLRRVIDRPAAESRVVTQPPGYKLEVGDEAFDVCRFEHSVSTGRSCLAQSDATEASRVLREGLDLWRGRVYAEFADEDWARPEVQRLDELRLVAYELLADAELGCGRAAEVVSTLEALTAENPMRESFHAQMMVALYRSGRQVEALRVYQAYRGVLAEELGLEPSPELAELERRILAHDEGLRERPTGELPLRGYRLGERLGTGRNGTVYAARLPALDREVAIRIVPEALANDPEFVRSFDADCRRLALLRHEALVPVHDWWREPGAAYVVMRRMRGGTLRDRLERGPLPGTEVAALVARVGAALVAAAEADIAHGRVVAESILFDEGGDAYLADFSLGTGRVRPPSEDVRDLAALIGEALTGHRCTTDTTAGLPAAVARVLATAVSRPDPPAVASVVDAVVAALAGDKAGPAYGRPNPYKGLRAFDEPDAADFFGRDALVDEITSRLAGSGPQARLVLVVGGSGCGKSSLVRAGLLPRVRRGAVTGSEHWFVADMVPGASPFSDLAESLRKVAVVETGGLAGELAASEQGIDRVLHRLVPGDEDLLLVLDQLEALFTLADEGEQRAFLNGLTHAISTEDSRLRVIATLRADFYDRPLRFERFGAAVGDATLPVAAMTAAELETAVVGPAERVGRHVEPALVAELVGAVLHEPAALPSLQFTLYELAERSPDGNLTLDAYRERGGVDAAIAERAEVLYRSLGDSARDGARRLFEQLVVVGAEGEPIRRRALRTDLIDAAGSSADDVSEIIQVWAHARLLTLDRHPETREPTVEVAHEALVREWPRLRDWLEKDREKIVALGHLREAAASWDALDRDPGALYRGARLEAALQLTEARGSTLPPPEQAFLEASRAERDRERRREAEHVERTARANRRLGAQLVALGIAFVIVLVAGSVAIGDRERADRANRTATSRELAAAADANVDVDPERSVLLALAAIEHTRSADGSVLPEAEAALHRAVTASRIELNVPGIGGRLDWNPDGTTFVTEGPENSGMVDIRHARTGESLRSFHAHEADVNEVAFNHDGTMLATTGDDGAARIWDPASGSERQAVQGDADEREVWGPTFSPDGTLFVAAWPLQNVVKVLDVATGQIVTEIRSVPAPLATSFDPSGTRLAVASAAEPMAAVVDAATGDELARLEAHTQPLTDLAWSPDGTSIATSSRDSSARIFDADSGSQRFALLGHTSDVMTLDWSPDSDRLVTASADGTAKVWLVTDGGPQALVTLSAQDTRSGVSGVAFSPDGSRVATGDVGIAAARVWDVGITGDAEFANLPAPRGVHGAAMFIPDGRYLIASGPAGSVTVWDARTFTRVRTLGDPGSSSQTPTEDEASDDPDSAHIRFIEVSPERQLVAAAGDDGRVRVWNADTGDEAFATRPGSRIDDIAWNPAGDLLAIAGGDDDSGSVAIVDRSGRTVAVIREEHGFAAGSVAFTPDGAQLITSRVPKGSDDSSVGQLVIWNWAEGTVERTIDTAAARAVPSPTGGMIATTSQGTATSRVVEVWDSATGQRRATLVGHTGRVLDLAFSADGSRLATAGADGTVRIWDTDAGEQLLFLRGHDRPVSSVAFGSDDAQLASVSADGTVRIWALELDDLVEIAATELTRTFTEDECQQYLHLARCP
jgi:WD40 repeat protein/DNA-binding SARP family transcriptional activator